MDPVFVRSPPLQSLLESKNPTPDVVVMGSTNTREISVTADSFSNSSATFSYNPSPNIVIDRTFLCEFTVDVTIRSPANNVVLSESDFCLAAFPLNRIIKSCTITLNNNAKSIPSHELINPFNWYHNDNWWDEATLYSCPSAPDCINNLNAASRPTLAAGTAPNSIYSSRPYMQHSQFAKYGTLSTNIAGRTSRATFLPVSYGANGTSRTLRYTWQEPIFHSFLSSKRDALCNVSNIRVDMVFNDLNAMVQCGKTCGVDGTPNWQIAPPSAAATVAIVPTAKPKLLLRTYTPSENIPASVEHHYNELVIRNFTLPAVANLGVEESYNTGTITFSTVPSKILIFLRPAADYTTSTQADALAVITKLTFRSDRDTGAFSNANQAQLFQMCKRNGYIGTWNEFSNYCGSPILIDVNNSDIGNWVAGDNTAFTFDLSVTYKDTTYSGWERAISNDEAAGTQAVDTGTGERSGDTGAVLNWKLFVVGMLDGKMVTQENMLNIVVGHSSSSIKASFDKAQATGGATVQNYDESVVKQGSGWFKDFRRGFKQGVRGVSSVVNGVAPLASMVNPALGAQAQAAMAGTNALRALTGSGYRLQG